jgi:hypothetical protein
VKFLSDFLLPAGAGAGKVLTSDVNGKGTWQAPTGGGTLTVAATAPSSPAANDRWIDSTTFEEFIWYDGAWVQLTIPGPAGSTGPQGDPGITVSATAPASPAVNDLWLDIS